MFRYQPQTILNGVAIKQQEEQKGPEFIHGGIAVSQIRLNARVLEGRYVERMHHAMMWQSWVPRMAEKYGRGV